MILEKNREYNRAELADWFGIVPKTFSAQREKKLEELKEYVNFDVLYTPTGKFKCIYVNEVFIDTYLKGYKADFIAYLSVEGKSSPWNLTNDEGISNINVVVNYYCNRHNIPYDGPHYLWDEDQGTSDDGKRKIKSMRKVANQEYRIWHYLRGIAERWYKANRIIDNKNPIDCCVGSWNPISIRRATEDDERKREEIYSKYFGSISKADIAEMFSIIDEMPDQATIKQMCEEIKDLKIVRQMSDKEKRLAAVQECINQDLLKRTGFQLKE